jgi:triacylglycerol lipase
MDGITVSAISSTTIIAFIILIIILLLVLWRLWYLKIVDEYNYYAKQYCDNLEEITYRQAVFVPENKKYYDKNLAIALVDISSAVSDANCDIALPNPPTFTQQTQLRANSLSTGRNLMYGYIFSNENSACFAFTGTSSIDQWKDDFKFTLVEGSDITGYQPGMKIHEGFYNIYRQLKSPIHTWLSTRKHIQHVYITGHSLGGALATICSLDLSNYSPIVYTFGAPRVGNPLFAEIYQNNVSQGIRINNTEDIITDLPLAAFENQVYQHVNQNLPFTISTGSLYDNHIEVYHNNLPEKAEVARSTICKTDNTSKNKTGHPHLVTAFLHQTKWLF